MGYDNISCARLDTVRFYERSLMMDLDQKKSVNKEEITVDSKQRNPLKKMFIIYGIIIFFLVILPLFSMFLSPYFKVFHYILKGYDWCFYQIKSLFLKVSGFFKNCYYWAFD